MDSLLGLVGRLVLAVVLVALLGGAPAFADGVVNDCKPNDDSGCSCDNGPLHTCDVDMAQPRFPHDLAWSQDLTSPPDACRELQRTMSPTPAEKALAASATRRAS